MEALCSPRAGSPDRGRTPQDDLGEKDLSPALGGWPQALRGAMAWEGHREVSQPWCMSGGLLVGTGGDGKRDLEGQRKDTARRL